jgi:hypothetical protein
MSIPIQQVLDLLKLEVYNLRFQQLGSDIAGPLEGLSYWNTTDHRLRSYDGTAWRTVPLLATTAPAALTIGASAVVGSSLDAAPRDHAHASPALATAGVDGFMPGTDKTKLDNAVSAATASRLVIRDASGRAQFADPSAAADAATKGYVDGLVNGLKWKQSVRVATAAAGTLATSFANGQTVDGVTLVTGDRILLRMQAAPAENGIYTVNASGAPTRALDMDAWAEIPGAACFVEVGSTLADKEYVCTSDAGGTLGTTAIVWSDITGGSIAANSVDNAKLAQMAAHTFKGNNSGSTANAADLSIAQMQAELQGAGILPAHTGDVTSSAGSVALTIAANAVGNTKLADMATATIKGRVTAATGDPEDLTAAQVRTLIGSPQKYTALVGNGSLTTITVAHNLNATGSICQVYEAGGSLREVMCEKQCTDVNTWTLLFATAPASNSLRVVVIG